MSFIHRPTSYRRRSTRVAWIGQIAIGGNYPIRVQSMTTSDTKDTASVLLEMEGLVNAGCEIVRVTVPTQADCDNLPDIRAAMKKRGIKVPLVADIHFTPSIAMKAVEYVDKVRINPGNFVDKKLFKVREYTDTEYGLELERIREKFVPLVLKCKEYGVAMRIGTNHGSLSDRILNRYGDTPLGMVESALEFLRICEELDFRNIILSMKASNVQVMTAAYRLLAARLDTLGWNYPFHLGVTEAGEGEDGRIKSAIGIGSLLEDGIGDTVRVSLTEDSIYEIPVCYDLVQKYNALHQVEINPSWEIKPLTLAPADAEYARRPTQNLNIGGLYHGEKHLVRVWTSVRESDFSLFEQQYHEILQSPSFADTPLEGIEVLSPSLEGFSNGKNGSIRTLLEKMVDLSASAPEDRRPILALRTVDPQEASACLPSLSKIVAVIRQVDEVTLSSWEKVIGALNPKHQAIEWNLDLGSLTEDSVKKVVTAIASQCEDHASVNALFSATSAEPVYDYRKLARTLATLDAEFPIHLRYQALSADKAMVPASVNLGCLLVDGIGDSLQIDGDLLLKDQIKVAYNILQGCRLRISKTEYISCPSCGRTLFNLQTTTDRIRERTGHLKGVKIAVMGCIVNGPGEMADADFGYVGTGPKKVSLYVGKECVERNIPEEDAVDRLIHLIKTHDRWIETVTP